MTPIFLIIGLINVLAQSKNYGIKTNSQNMDIRVRRDVSETDIRSEPYQLFNINNSKRDKRQLLLYTPKYSSNGITPRYNYNSRNNLKLDYNFATQNNGMLNGYPRLINNNTDINYYNNWRISYSNNNNTGIYNHYNNTGFMHYAYNNITNDRLRNNGNHDIRYYNQPYITRFNTSSGYQYPLYNYTYNGYGYNSGNWMYGYNNNIKVPTQTYNKSEYGYHNTYPLYNYANTGYNNQTPRYNGYANTEPIPIYNYQDPTKSNAKGNISNNGIVSGFNYYNVTIKPYAPGYLPIPVFNGVKTGNGSSHWYDKFNFTPSPYEGRFEGVTEKDNANVATTTEIILTSSIIRTFSCPTGQHRRGIFCVPDVYDSDY